MDFGGKPGPCIIGFPERHANAPMLILLVEDEAFIEMVVEEVLTAAGHEVIGTRTGEAAIGEFLNRRPRPDALVVDNHLPDIMGWRVVEVCRSVAPRLPVVMCSGDFATGASDMRAVVRLEKPFSETALLDAIADAVNRAKAGST